MARGSSFFHPALAPQAPCSTKKKSPELIFLYSWNTVFPLPPLFPQQYHGDFLGPFGPYTTPLTVSDFKQCYDLTLYTRFVLSYILYIVTTNLIIVHKIINNQGTKYTSVFTKERWKGLIACSSDVKQLMLTVAQN